MATLGFSDLKMGTIFEMEGDPWEVIFANRVMIGRGQGHLETKIRNLRNGNVLSRNFSKSDKFEEADIELSPAEFVYAGKGKATFRDPKNPKERSEIDTAAIENKLGYLIEGMIVKLILFDDQVIGISLPPKVDLRVTQADPWSKGDTATGGTKQVSVETGLIVKVPPFIVTDDIVCINTETGEYVERTQKA